MAGSNRRTRDDERFGRMLIEAVLHATAQTTPALRRLGLVGDAVALWSRATRLRRAWAPHEARCHEVVRSAVDRLARRRTVVVLGSGLIRDVPFDDLVQAFDRVVLVDAVHLWPARRRSRHAAVERVVADLTGFADRLAGSAAGRSDAIAGLKADPAIDLVVSAMVLSQLPMALEGWVERHPAAAALPPDLGRAVVERHLADLRAFSAPICLLTDIAYQDRDRSGTVVSDEPLLHGVVLPEPDAAWDWEIAPFGEIERGFARTHRVHGWTRF